MSSRFVSGGTIAGDNNSADLPVETTTTTPSTSVPSTAQASAWEKAQAQLESDRRAREAARKAAVESSSGQQSLYDVLQANKAAKQAAFEEANKIKNQFRALDDDEVDFLDEVEARERREAEEKRHAEEVGLREFRDAQRKLEGGGTTDLKDGGSDEVSVVADAADDEWSTGVARKRKREKEPLIKGIKRRVSGNVSDGTKRDDLPTASIASPVVETTKAKSEKSEAGTKPDAAPLPSTAKSKIDLVNYGSDEEEDDD